MKIKKFSFQKHGDERGMLVSLEENKEIPFLIKRVYYMFDTKKGVVRGKHAHKTLEQILICVHGSCKILLDDGYSRQTIILDNPSEGIYLKGLIWREMFDFSEDAVLMVLASDIYLESDYIRDFEQFKRTVTKRN